MARLGGEVAPMMIQEFVSRQTADRARYGAFNKEAGTTGVKPTAQLSRLRAVVRVYNRQQSPKQL